MTWEGLTPPYATIVADPPWPYEDNPMGDFRGGRLARFLPYSTMSLEAIAALPVGSLAAPGAHLYLWTTNRYLEAAFGIVRAWGFVPACTLTWCKPPLGLGPGGRFASTTEFVLHALPVDHRVARAGQLIREAREAVGMGRARLHELVRGGKPTGIVFRWEEDACLPTDADWQRLQQVLPSLASVQRPEPPSFKRVETSWWQWPRGFHSEKPPAFLDQVEKVSPGPYVELFARQPRLGWDSWGWGYEGAIA